MHGIKTVGIVGAGVIGSGWSARYLAHGLDVIATDPGPGAEELLRAKVDKAWPALQNLGLMPGANRNRLRFTADLEEVCQTAHFIQENAPEREGLKRNLHREMDALTPPEVIIASSSSGLLPTSIQADCQFPGRIVVGHPFNPVYLLPLVEVLGGEKTLHASIERAIAFYRWVGMYPLHVRQEIEGYISDRLQEAMWREALHLVNDGIATTAEVDDAVVYGPGLRWAIMGTCLTFHLAGGDAGLGHMLEQFGPALKLPWTKLEAPELTNHLIERMVAGTQQQAAGKNIEELERLRDDCLMGRLFCRFRDDPTLRVAIITGGGQKFFSAGWDLNAAAEGEDINGDYGPGGFAGITELHDLNKPVIAAVNGMAVGGGFELALACDLIVAADHVQFFLPEIFVGVLADAASFRLPKRLPHQIAMEMLLTGRRMEADEAKQWGLVNAVAPQEKLMDKAREYAETIIKAAPLSIAAIKEVTRATEALGVKACYDLMRSGNLTAYQRMLTSADAKEGPKAFTEKREPVWQGR